MKSLLKKTGELGLLGIAVPEEYGGFGQSFITQMLVAETTGAAIHFLCLHGPLRNWYHAKLYYGNEEQRQKYVTRLATGEHLVHTA